MTMAQVPYERATFASLPFLFTHLGVLTIVSLWPGLIPWMPEMLI